MFWSTNILFTFTRLDSSLVQPIHQSSSSNQSLNHPIPVFQSTNILFTFTRLDSSPEKLIHQSSSSNQSINLIQCSDQPTSSSPSPCLTALLYNQSINHPHLQSIILIQCSNQPTTFIRVDSSPVQPINHSSSSNQSPNHPNPVFLATNIPFTFTRLDSSPEQPIHQSSPFNYSIILIQWSDHSSW